MSDKQETTLSQAFTRTRIPSNETPVKEPVPAGKTKLELMLAKVLAFEPQVRLSNLDYVRGLFDALETKRKAGATYEELAALLKDADFDVNEGTLKTLMSKIRVEKGIKYVKCPCCQTRVPKSLIAEQYRDVVEAAAESVNDA